MMADTIRELIIQDIVSQLETLIGYGDVYRGRTYFVHDDLPAISVLPGVETGESRHFGEQFLILPVAIHAVQVIGENEPSPLAEEVLGALVDNIIGGRSNIGHTNDIRYIGGGVEDYPAVEEQTISVHINIEIEYSINVGDPYNQTNI